MKMIDLRSDTVTKPTRGMLEAMFSAEVGDDVLGDDPSVNALQEKVATLFGMEAALFCPSGTMTNQIALRIATEPQDEVICDKHSHIYLYEGGGMASNGQVSPKLLDGDRGRITAEMVEAHINPEHDVHFPRTRLVGIENTMNKGGGSIYALTEIQKIRNICDRHRLNLHMDGARFFNALAETGEDPVEYGKLCDTISICFSKGLGAPVGSVLLANNEMIRKARRVRKAFGGGMRQAGYLAAACSYALDHHRTRLTEDHRRARIIGEELKRLAHVSEVYPVDTNIVIAVLDQIPVALFLEKLRAKGILAVPFGPQSVRFVTHLDVTDDQLDQVIKIIGTI